MFIMVFDFKLNNQPLGFGIKEKTCFTFCNMQTEQIINITPVDSLYLKNTETVYRFIEHKYLKGAEIIRSVHTLIGLLDDFIQEQGSFLSMITFIEDYYVSYSQMHEFEVTEFLNCLNNELSKDKESKY
jgi:hypothetical protein